MIKTFYLAKALFKMRLTSYRHCEIDKTARVNSACVLTKVSMGRYSYIGADTCVTDAVIGSFCSIGSNCQIGGGNHPIDRVSTSPVFLKGRNILKTNFADFEYAPSSTVHIGHDVWIGDGVYIKSGVSIASGAVIGAHAVVTHDVGPYEIVAGVPASIIRKRLQDDQIQRLLELQWWNWSDEKLRNKSKYFSSVEDLLSNS